MIMTKHQIIVLATFTILAVISIVISILLYRLIFG